MAEDDVRYRFIFDSVSKYSPTDLNWEEFKTSIELSKFCDDSATLLLSCVFTKQGKLLLILVAKLRSKNSLKLLALVPNKVA